MNKRGKSKSVEPVEPPVQPDKRQIYYDISRLRQEDVIDINLANGPLFMASLANMQKCCTRGGTIQNGKPVTYVDPDHPVCVANMRGMYKGKDVSSSFLILKADIYTSGCCFGDDDIRVGHNWMVLEDSRVIIFDGNTASFGVSYLAGGTSSKNKSATRLPEFVGLEILLSALYYLRFGRDNEKIPAFHSICHHLSEASRIREVANLVLDGFELPRPIGDVHLLFNQWRYMCKCHRDKIVVGVEFETMKEGLKARVGENNFEKIDTFDKLDRCLITILVENKETRKKRRMVKLQKNKGALAHYINRVRSKNIVPRTAHITRNWTKAQLAEFRNTELERLIAEKKEEKLGKRDIWTCLKEACCETSLPLKKLKIKHTDVNVKKPDLSEAYDDDGFRYIFGEPKEREYMLCDPHGILP